MSYLNYIKDYQPKSLINNASITTQTTTNGTYVRLPDTSHGEPMFIRMKVTNFVGANSSLRLKLEAGFFAAAGDAAPTVWKEIFGNVDDANFINDSCILDVKSTAGGSPLPIVDYEVIQSSKLTNPQNICNTANIVDGAFYVIVALSSHNYNYIQFLRASVVSTITSGTLASNVNVDIEYKI
jgi:hypothetical protein